MSNQRVAVRKKCSIMPDQFYAILDIAEWEESCRPLPFRHHFSSAEFFKSIKYYKKIPFVTRSR